MSRAKSPYAVKAASWSAIYTGVKAIDDYDIMTFEHCDWSPNPRLVSRMTALAAD